MRIATTLDGDGGGHRSVFILLWVASSSHLAGRVRQRGTPCLVRCQGCITALLSILIRLLCNPSYVSQIFDGSVEVESHTAEMLGRGDATA